VAAGTHRGDDEPPGRRMMPGNPPQGADERDALFQSSPCRMLEEVGESEGIPRVSNVPQAGCWSAVDPEHVYHAHLGNRACQPRSCAVITRNKRAATIVAVGWVLVSLLPWWQLRVAFSDWSGSGTEVFSVDVWRASTPAALAVVLAAVVSVVLVATRGQLPQTRGQRGMGLIIAWLPVVLLGWAAWSISRLTAGPPVYGSSIMELDDDVPLSDDFHVVHDGLAILTLPGYAQGPAWGLYVGVVLVLVATASATVRLLRPAKP
jgi:hypothetical protein